MRHCIHFAGLGDFLPAGNACVGFLIQFLCFFRAAALSGQPQNGDRFGVITLTQRYFGIQFHQLAGFPPLAVVMHFAAINHLSCQRAGLIKTSCPQPFIETYRVIVVVRFTFHLSPLNLPELFSRACYGVNRRQQATEVINGGMALK